MTLTRVIGDIHGHWDEYVQVATLDFDGPTIQLGDIGVGFSGPYWHDRADEFHRGGKHRFIRGNHDSPQKCKEMVGWIPDGYVENDMMFVGGAWSIDQWCRTEGTSWWRDEECSYGQFLRMLDTYAVAKPRVMFTHDCPHAVANQMFVQAGLAMGGASAKLQPTITGQGLQAMFDIHQPELWFHGHWHHTLAYKYGRTHFQCLGELNFMDVEL
jgi:hypothetical protein